MAELTYRSTYKPSVAGYNTGSGSGYNTGGGNYVPQNLQQVTTVGNETNVGVVFANTKTTPDKIEVYTDADGNLRVRGSLVVEGDVMAYATGAALPATIWEKLGDYVDGTTVGFVNNELVVLGGGDVEEAPADGGQYARKNEAWVPIDLTNAGTSQSFYQWTWSQGVAGVGNTYVDFVIPGADVGEIFSLESCILFIGGSVQTGTYSIQSTNVTNDTLRVLVAPGDVPAGAEVVLYYNKLSSENGIPDAPADGKQYARKDEDWVEVVTPEPADELTADELAAINGANAPEALNPFATMADILEGVGPNINEWFVDFTNGNDTTGNGSKNLPFKTAAQVHSAMASGDTVYVSAIQDYEWNTFVVDFAWTKNVSLRGYNTLNTTPEGGYNLHKENKSRIDFIAGGSCNCDRLEIINFECAEVSNSNANSVITLRNCRIDICGSFAGKVRAYDCYLDISGGGYAYYKYEEAIGCYIKYITLSSSSGFTSVFKECVFSPTATTQVGANGNAILYNCHLPSTALNFVTTGTITIPEKAYYDSLYGAEVRVTLTQAQILTLNSIPISLVAAPGSNKCIEILSCVIANKYVTAAFATATTCQIKDSGGVVRYQSSTSFIQTTAVQVEQMAPVSGPVGIKVNAALQVTANANPTAGNSGSTIIIYLKYRIVSV